MHYSNAVLAWARAVEADAAEARAQLGLDDRELTALTLVGEHAGCTTEWLRHRVGLTQSGTVRLVDRLVGRGFLRRVAAPGRSVPLHVTGPAAELLDAWAVARDDAVDRALAGLDAAQREVFLEAVRAALTAVPRDRRAADATCGACTWPACGADCPVDRSVVEEHDGG